MTEPTTPTIVPTWAVSVIQDKHARLVKIAARLGVEGPTLTIGEPFTGPLPSFWWTSRQAEQVELLGALNVASVNNARLVEVTAGGASPVLPGGWHVLATVDHDPAGNMVGCAPAGQALGLAASLVNAAPTCDHCGHDRNRLRTVVLRNEAGEVKRVGSTCLRSFLGFHGAALDNLWVLMCESSTDADEDAYRSARDNAGHALLDVLVAAAASIRQFGFVSTQVEYGRSTRDNVGSFLGARNEQQRRFALDSDPTNEDEATALATLAWIEASTDESDYMTNARTLAARGHVGKHLGLAVSLPFSHAKHLGKIAARKAAAEAKAAAGPVPVGRTILTGTVIATDTKWSDYGARYVMTVLLDNGSKVWGSEPTGYTGSDHEIEVGDRITFTATVEAKDGDDKFGFYKRPTKATVTPVTPNEPGRENVTA